MEKLTKWFDRWSDLLFVLGLLSLGYTAGWFARGI